MFLPQQNILFKKHSKFPTGTDPGKLALNSSFNPCCRGAAGFPCFLFGAPSSPSGPPLPPPPVWQSPGPSLQLGVSVWGVGARTVAGPCLGTGALGQSVLRPRSEKVYRSASCPRLSTPPGKGLFSKKNKKTMRLMEHLQQA